MKKRKDNKGRILKDGEYQRANGQYEYRYTDSFSGKQRSVYAWRLNETDGVHIFRMQRRPAKESPAFFTSFLLWEPVSQNCPRSSLLSQRRSEGFTVTTPSPKIS